MSTDEIIEGLMEDERTLRRLLAFAYSGADLYTDDGELQDQEIDYLRDSVTEIERKITKRGESAVKKYFDAILTEKYDQDRKANENQSHN